MRELKAFSASRQHLTMSAVSERRTNATGSPVGAVEFDGVAAPRVSLASRAVPAHTALILHAGAKNAESRPQTTSQQRA
jgi:hypothetical protein